MGFETKYAVVEMRSTFVVIPKGARHPCVQALPQFLGQHGIGRNSHLVEAISHVRSLVRWLRSSSRARASSEYVDETDDPNI